MSDLQDPDTTQPWQSWHDAARQPDIDSGIGQLYARLDAAIAARSPTCWQSGKCCHFDAYDHLLYVTGLEVAWFLKHMPDASAAAVGEVLPPASRPHVSLPQWPAKDATLPPACPYQVDGKCSTHAIRPLGCRVFFCQQGTQDWQQTIYETFLNELRQLHEQYGIPYRYMEWRTALREAR